MNDLTMQLKEVLESKLAQLGQAHLLQFWDELNDVQQASLARQIGDIDFQELQKLIGSQQDENPWAELAAKANVPPAFTLSDLSNPDISGTALELGRQALQDGKLGMILVAGGQGSRLGFDHPKGMFPIGPVTDRTLYQIHFEHLHARAKQFQTRIPMYVMTSPPTHQETTDFLAQRNYFGFPAEDVKIFCQGTMPAIDQSGKLLLETKDKIFVSPDGHGGMLGAFDKSGCLQDVIDRGIEHLFYGQVDNPLIQICEPTLIGHHIQRGSEMTSQVVRKQEPTQKVGNVVEIDGKVQIIEYSDLPEESAKQVNEDGELKLWAGSIAVHVFSVDFLKRSAANAESLPFHKASKKVSFVDAEGKSIDPDQPNAIKFEKFIFDLLPNAQNAIVCEVDPADGFCAVKNAAPAKSETPEHVKSAISDLHTRWLNQAGVYVEPGVQVELSPEFAVDFDTLKSQVDPSFAVFDSKYIQGVEDFDIREIPRSALYATIMAGGAGTRFWPASRKALPKQLLSLAGERTMIQSTTDRLEGLCSSDQLMIVTNQSLVDSIAEQLPEIPRELIIGEPAKRDTAPCVGLAAALIANKDPEAVMAVMPADHVIQPPEVFREAIDYAASLVDQDPSRIVTFGIKPSYPAEVFGYIERENHPFSEDGFPTYGVNRFREKPDAQTAQQFLDSGNFYWNAGIFVWKVQTILDAIQKFEPEMHVHLQNIADSIGTDQFQATLQSEFSAIEGKSIDFAVMEHYDNVLVVEAPFQWDDLGNWSAMPRLLGTDAQGNTIQGEHLGLDTENSIVRTEDGHLIVTIGMKD
ncbi:MAG: UTP--glucose-1-phosphate uridylyltransferase, partial [Planctomycetota bacterium]